ncbi:response regulator transcription factor [Pseudochryseolinea flava]|uniref:DNA-binding response regulator n=1 Tax=Pseudochryseolinea flava TaxID=2059302 RepID=A0A364XZA9_9BACT|nr:response regulator transcription factor [Pseudochryseolinea flava]RAV99724.1 DNA-binding response regulator [Pseudochryseolinea flava]
MKIKILYVEDEPFLGRIVKESLESRDFEVDMVTDGKDAVDFFSKTNPDICVLDVMLPSKDGFTIAKEIRKITPAIPIIFVTAKIQTEDLIKGFDVGGNDYIRKPFSMEELIVRVNNLLALSKNQKNSQGHDSICIGKYEFVPMRYELRFQGNVKKLSHRESTLLQALIENKNATTLRKDILIKLWGDDSFFNSRTLDVYITKLRDYLKDDNGIQIITIKGIGYHFSVG